MYLNRAKFWAVMLGMSIIMLVAVACAKGNPGMDDVMTTLSIITMVVMYGAIILRIRDTGKGWMFLVFIMWILIQNQLFRFMCLLLVGSYPTDEYRDMRKMSKEEQDAIEKEEAQEKRKKQEEDFYKGQGF